MNGIIYEDSDSWWTKHGDKVLCVIGGIVLFAIFAWGVAFP